jgi:PAS domain S-box-containing protein
MNPDGNNQVYPGEKNTEHNPHLDPTQTSLFLWIFDYQGNILTVNDTVLQKLGYRQEDLVGKHFSVLEVFSVSRLKDVFQHIDTPDSTYKSESRIKKKDGTFLNVYMIGERIAFLNGSYTLISAIGPVPVHVINIYSGKDGGQNLNEIQSYKDNIFSVIAHDLRSPFNTILGYCELLNSSIINGELNKSVMYTRIIKDATEQTLSFLVRLLDWGRLQNDQPPFNPVYFDADLPIKQITRLCAFQADTKNILLRTEIEANLKVYGDLNMIRTVLVNLISNSIKFCNPGGKIIIKTYSVAEGVEFDVADNGIGINKEVLRSLFSSDKPHSTSGTRMEHGTGLGLAICKSYIAIHQGRFWADSEPGTGSTFKFVLPFKNLV